MTVPLGVIYILANMTFQMAVKNSSEDGLNCTQCWNYTGQLPHLKYFNAFKLMHWYYNPALWVIILCFGQALSHLFERKCTGIPNFLIRAVTSEQKSFIKRVMHASKKWANKRPN